MKIVIALILLIVAANVAYYYGSCYVMGGIEAGLPHGGHGKFKEYHEGNVITKYFKGRQDSRGAVSVNPYTQKSK